MAQDVKEFLKNEIGIRAVKTTKKRPIYPLPSWVGFGWWE